MNKRNGEFISYWIIFIFLAIGAAITIWGSIVLRNASVSRNWPETHGKITASYVSASTDDEGSVSYYAEIEYEYVVDDRWLSDDTVNFGELGSSNPAQAEEIVSSYPVGKEIPVYYNPDNPQTAVLEPGVTWGSYFLLFFGLLFLVIPLIFLAIIIRSQ